MKINSHTRYRVLCDYIAGENIWLQVGQVIEIKAVALIGQTPGHNACAGVLLMNGQTVPLDVFQAVCEDIKEDGDDNKNC